MGKTDIIYELADIMTEKMSQSDLRKLAYRDNLNYVFGLTDQELREMAHTFDVKIDGKRKKIEIKLKETTDADN